MAHETRIPLTLIGNYLDKYIKKHGLHEDLSVIKKNIDRLKTDMLYLLDVQKLENGQNIYDHGNVLDLSGYLLEKIILCKETAQRKDITFTSDIEEAVYIKCDSRAMDRIVNNLFDNAVKFASEKGAVSMTLKSRNSHIRLSVSNTGQTIPPEQDEKIFLPYYQASQDKHNNQGIGLGLFIVRKIVDTLKGRIEFDSVLNEKTTFTIILHRYETKQNKSIVRIERHTASPEPGIGIADCKYSKNKKNILIVEDNAEMLDFLRQEFMDTHNVFAEWNGKAALNKLREMPKPDVIISDVMMNEMDGYALFDIVSNNKSYNDIPFIFLTARNVREERIRKMSE